MSVVGIMVSERREKGAFVEVCRGRGSKTAVVDDALLAAEEMREAAISFRPLFRRFSGDKDKLTAPLLRAGTVRTIFFCFLSLRLAAV